MVTWVRFATAREVFEAFPTVIDDVSSRPTDDPPLEYLRRLADGPTPEDAIAFCAYVLPRREAVWWACRCLRALAPSFTTAEAAALQAAEDWVTEPEDERRVAAMSVGMKNDRKVPATWAALAAAWSGGSMIDDGEYPVPAPPHLTAKAARVAVLGALARVSARDRARQLNACLDIGFGLVGESLTPDIPGTAGRNRGGRR